MEEKKMNKDQEEDVSTASTCSICKQVILMVVERWGKMKCCKEMVHFACLMKTLNEQMNRGVTNEKLYCKFCNLLCHLSHLMSKLFQD